MDITVSWPLLLLASMFFGAAVCWFFQRLRLGTSQQIATQILTKAEQDAATIRHKSELEIQQRAIEHERSLQDTLQQERQKFSSEEERLKQREDKLEQRVQTFDRKLFDFEKREAQCANAQELLTQERSLLNDQRAALQAKLEHASGITLEEAKEQLCQRAMQACEGELAHLVSRRRQEAEESAERIASTIIATAINRLAVRCTSEATVTTVSLPSDEMKGRVIGREGRNIRLLERELGVNILVDDTPGAIVLSGFDPIRKHLAKMVLSDLLQDGRIHPTRIQEVIERQKQELDNQIIRYGEDAAARAGAINMHPELMALLGRLKFRFSYGQNILEHSLEVSYLMGLMAEEMGLDASLARRIGLLHDVGKAVSHEMPGSHALIGKDLALKYGETSQVANGIGCHHREIEAATIEGSLCGAADALSASRPGARSGALDEYVKRLQELEEITQQFSGVEKAYAMQAGREVYISVLPDVVDDAGLENLARDISRRIEEKLNYPGRIKVTIVREKRIVAYAG